MIGRREELAVVEDMALAARRGEGQTALVTAEAGLGKSRLAREVSRWAQREGFTVLWGHCSEAELALPYLPVVEAISDFLVGVDKEALRTRLGAGRRELAGLFPSLADEGYRADDDPMRAKLRLFEAITEVLGMAAEPGGLLLVLEDLHWADGSTRDLLDFLVRRVRRMPVMILGTARSDELNRRHPLYPMVQAWTRADLALTIQLAPLAPAQMTEMVRAILDVDDLNRQFQELLYARTEGNPFVVEEILKDTLDQGEISVITGGAAPGDVDRLRVPRSVAEGILMRLERLDPPVAEVLRAASVLGRSFAYDTLAALTGTSDAELEAAVRTGIAEQLLEEDPQSPRRYRFHHGLTRETIYEDLIGPRRLQLHARAAEVLAQQLGAAAVDVARHLLAAGDVQKAMPICIDAAQEAMRRRGYQEAVELYQRVLPHLTSPVRRGEVLCEMGEAYRRLGDAGLALESIAEGVRLLEENGWARTAARHRVPLGSCYWQSGDTARAREQFEAARAQLETEPASEDLATAYIRLASLHAFQFEGEECEAMARRAVAVAHDALAPGAEVWALNFLGVGLVEQGKVDEGIASLDKSYRDAMALDRDLLASNALYNSIELRLHHGRARECPELLAKMRELPRSWWQSFQVHHSESVMHYQLGDLGRALAASEQAETLASEAGAEIFVRWVTLQQALILAELGRLEEARAALPETSGEDRQDLFLEAWSRIRVALAAGDAAGAAEIAAPLVAQEWTHRVPLLACLAAEAFTAAGRLADAAALIPITDMPGHEANPLLLFPRGLATVAAGDRDAGLALLRQAAERFAATGYRLDEGRARLALAAVEAAAGDSAAAATELEAAMALATACGAGSLEAAVRQQAAATGVTLAARRRPVSEAPVEPAREAPAGHRLTLIGDLRRVVRAGQLVLYYMPKIDLTDGHMEAVEALLRWQHPRLGLLPPDRFIPIAEQIGVIKSLTAWALESALEQCRAWLDHGIHLRVAVNMSTQDLEDRTFANIVAEALAAAQVDPAMLQLEITETGIMSRPEQAQDTLRSLKRVGVQLSIDDFGIGQSSLSYLKRFGADEIKLDKSFCLDIDENDIAIIRSAVTLGHDLGMRVAAEGVDSDATAALLAELGCDIAQGYFAGKPVPPAEIERRAGELRARLTVRPED